jgi:hypothetical protein
MPTVSESQVHGHLGRLRALANELEIEADYFRSQITPPVPISPDDTQPHEPAALTIPSPPRSEPAPVVRRGQARLAVLQALASVANAVGQLEALAVAIARALDASSHQEHGDV